MHLPTTIAPVVDDGKPLLRRGCPMSRKVGYRFKPAHEKMPVKWRPLSFFLRSILRELWLASENGFLETEIRYLVRDYLYADTKADRSNLTAGVTKLAEKGFLTADARGVTVQLEPVERTIDSPSIVHGHAVDSPKVPASVNPSQPKPLKSLDCDLTDQIRLRREREIARAREEAPEGGVRSPDVEPPEHYAARFKLAEWIESKLAVRGREVLGHAPSTMRRHTLELAAFCLKPESQADFRQASPQNLASEVVEGWLTAPKMLNGRRPPFAYASKCPEDYLGHIQKKIAAQKAAEEASRPKPSDLIPNPYRPGEYCRRDELGEEKRRAEYVPTPEEHAEFERAKAEALRFLGRLPAVTTGRTANA